MLGYCDAKRIEEAEGLSNEVGKMINAILQSLTTSHQPLTPNH